jgi:hypothetical protein
MTIKPVAQSFLIGLILVMACKAQPQNRGDDPVRVEEFVVSDVKVTLNYFDHKLLHLDGQIKDVI